jgi:Prolipoprotein diacylglyceryl transferase
MCCAGAGKTPLARPAAQGKRDALGRWPASRPVHALGTGSGCLAGRAAVLASEGMAGTLARGLFIPSPPVNGFHIGPAFVHFYGLMYVIAIVLAIYITRRRLTAAGGNPGLVYDVALWAVPAGIVGARIYFLITTPFDIVPKHVWWGRFAVWDGATGRSGRRACSRCTWRATPATGSSRKRSGSTRPRTSSACG